jgi:hypothetical protein
MIVRPANGALHLITQPDHAALSRRIMEQWLPLADRPRRSSILLAIGEHDNGWREADDDPTLDTNGRVVDFVNAPADAKQAVWPRGVARLSRDPWAAALVAQHAITVYARFRGDPDWSGFFAEMETTRDRLVETAPLSVETLLDDYHFVRLGDLLSLTFCTAWTEPQQHDRWTVLHHADRVIITPDGFGHREIAIDVPAIAVTAERFTSAAMLRQALAAAPRVRVSGLIAPA